LPLPPIHAALGFAFLDIKVAFEIVVFCLLHNLAKGTQANRNLCVRGPVFFPAWRVLSRKANMSAGEIDPGGIRHHIEIWWLIKTCICKNRLPRERSAFEDGLAIESRPCKNLIHRVSSTARTGV
jgi:hypothetical protein